MGPRFRPRDLGFVKAPSYAAAVCPERRQKTPTAKPAEKPT